jgi:MOSC domain-containing protein YiiM
MDHVQVLTDYGLEGDWRSRSGRGRQVTLIAAESLVQVAETLGLDAIPDGASRRQIVIAGLSLDSLLGRRLRLGPVLVQLTETCEPCQNMERKIGRGAQEAMRGHGGVCARVLEGGLLHAGDPVELLPDIRP